ncbi:MAG: zinc ribbon domain-containing protein [Thioalkalivibrio sp.]|nr:MAG: zinc ribbon domain-containing protein [Thioalkalivibrio sp.]
MPIYEYECRSCGGKTEVIQKFSDPAMTDCPSCGAPELSKLVSAAGFRLAGGGWYETDFKKDGKRNLKESPKPDGGKPATGGTPASSPGGCATNAQAG